MCERPARLIFFHCVASSFRAAPTRRTAPSCNNQTVPHLLWPTEENLFLPLGSLSYYFFFFLYDHVLFCVHINLRVKFCLWGFFSGRGHRILFIFSFILYIQVMLLHVCRANAYIVSCSSCTYTHTTHTHRHKELHWPVLVLRSELGFHI